VSLAPCDECIISFVRLASVASDWMAVYPWVQEEASAVGQLRCAVAGLCQIHHLVKQVKSILYLLCFLFSSCFDSAN
jgi:hypothetical protein